MNDNVYGKGIKVVNVKFLGRMQENCVRIKFENRPKMFEIAYDPDVFKEA